MAVAGVTTALGAAALAIPAHASGTPHPDLAVTLEGYSDVNVGSDYAPFTATVTNIGTELALTPVLHIAAPPDMAGSVQITGPDGPGECVQDGLGATCSLASLAPGESQFASVVYRDLSAGSYWLKAEADVVPGEIVVINNVATLQTNIHGYATTTTASAPATAQLWQPFTVLVKVKAAGNGAGTPTGTVTVDGRGRHPLGRTGQRCRQRLLPADYEGPAHPQRHLYGLEQVRQLDDDCEPHRRLGQRSTGGRPDVPSPASQRSGPGGHLRLSGSDPRRLSPLSSLVRRWLP